MSVSKLQAAAHGCAWVPTLDSDLAALGYTYIALREALKDGSPPSASSLHAPWYQGAPLTIDGNVEDRKRWFEGYGQRWLDASSEDPPAVLEAVRRDLGAPRASAAGAGAGDGAGAAGGAAAGCGGCLSLCFFCVRLEQRRSLYCSAMIA